MLNNLSYFNRVITITCCEHILHKILLQNLGELPLSEFISILSLEIASVL